MNSWKLAWWVPSAQSSVPTRRAVRMPIISIWRCTRRLLSCTMSGGSCATRWASSSTRASSWSAGTARVAQPRLAASTPEIESPVTIISIAMRMPTSQAWKCMSGTPKRTAG